MNNYFESPFVGKSLKEQVTNPNIIVGEHSYYSGYYHNHSFDDCARYLLPDRTDVDKLIIGSYCSIGSGAVFMMAGHQGHQPQWISTFPFFYQGNENFADAKDGFQRAGDTVIGNDVEPYSIVGSNPAKHIRYRFTEQKIAILLEIQWWTWTEEQLKGAMPLMCSEDIDGLHRYWQNQVLE
ncbi:N-acetylglutamate synthase [Moritella sp. JT01]|uniref:CatB-related O-acetyltransferase n=1 Tax=Moritella sp. JT01 TaxID=756698 RepID=UPI000798EBFB|nr:CatB-related O-acetyltransferase [Moritella sp. JT01]KXO09233.1 N-acetylglutamate synthase [Moritella sp. JT01]